MNLLFHYGVSNVLVAAILALAAALVSRWGRRPALAHGLWLLVLLKLLAPPLLPLSVPWPISQDETFPQAIAAITLPVPVPVPLPDEFSAPEIPAPLFPEGPDPKLSQAPEIVPPEPTPPFPWTLVLTTIWGSGSLAWFGLAAFRWLAFHRLLRFAQPAIDPLRAEAVELAALLNVSCPPVRVLPGVVSPMLYGVGPWLQLLVPETLLARLSQDQRATLLAHELAHLRRRDHWVRLLELTVLGLYWWCPLAWWACRELRQAEEECCDAWVVWALPSWAGSYARALVDTLDYLSEARPALPPVASGMGAASQIRRRLTMILTGKPPRALTLAGTLAVMAVGALLLPLWPSWAQEKERPAPPPPKEGAKEDFKPKFKVQHIDLNMDRARAELSRIEAELREMQENLRRAQDRLRQAEGKQGPQGERPDHRPPQGERPGNPPHPGPGNPQAGFNPPRVNFTGGVPGGPRPELERRLDEVERKLDRILQELTRREPGRGLPALPPPDGVRRPQDPNQPQPPNPPRRPGAGGQDLDPASGRPLEKR